MVVIEEEGNSLKFIDLYIYIYIYLLMFIGYSL